MSDQGQEIEMSIPEAMQSLALALDRILNGSEVLTDTSKRKNGFVLMLYPYHATDGNCDFVTNGASKEAIIGMFKKQIVKFEQKNGDGSGEA